QGKGKGKGKAKGKVKHHGAVADTDLEGTRDGAVSPEGDDQDMTEVRGKPEKNKDKRSKRRRGKGKQAKLDKRGDSAEEPTTSIRPDRRPKRMKEPKGSQGPAGSGPETRVRG
ncbi:MAG: hypothetical protein ACPHRO_02245, partial [Nannocystaceae bacterium]